MTIAQAEDFFVKEGYQPRPVAVSESKRGTSDPTYGYYTMGKLMILKLREDYKAKMGAEYSLQKLPRHVHQPGTAAPAADSQGDARRGRAAVLSRNTDRSASWTSLPRHRQGRSPDALSDDW